MRSKAPGLSWDWAAMVFTFGWLRYHGMYAYSWVYFLVSTPVLFFLWTQLPPRDGCVDALGGIWLTPQATVLALMALGFLAPPLIADRVRFHFVTRKAAALGREPATGTYWGSELPMAGVFLLAVIVGPSRGDTMSRVEFKIEEVIRPVSALERATADFLRTRGRLPESFEEIEKTANCAGGRISECLGVARSRGAKTVTLEKNGTIRVVMGFEPVAGRSVLLVPSVSASKLEWTCRSDDLPPKCVPENCGR